MMSNTSSSKHTLVLFGIWLFLVAEIRADYDNDPLSDDLINDSNSPFFTEEFVLSGTGDKAESFDGVQPKRRSRRAALSLPDNTSCKISFDLSVNIDPLNNTYTSLTLSLPFRFVLPTYQQLNDRYETLAKLEDDLSGQENLNNLIDYDFLEEQRANEQRQTIYQHIETMFTK